MTLFSELARQVVDPAVVLGSFAVALAFALVPVLIDQALKRLKRFGKRLG